MEEKHLEIKVAIQIQKSANEVFEAIVDLEKMSKYFISKGNGRLEGGKVVMWRFPEFDMEFPVRGDRIEKDKYVSFFWDVDGRELLVEISLTLMPDNSTVVRITEKGMPPDEKGIKWLQGNSEGWANFLACLKAYLEYGINLRKGAFDFMASGDQNLPKENF
jgi:uncharacterized protein YndB with AHSA1/START domain